MKSAPSTDRDHQPKAMLDAREQWWSNLSERGDPLSQVNVFDSFAAGFYYAVKAMKEATK